MESTWEELMSWRSCASEGFRYVSEDLVHEMCSSSIQRIRRLSRVADVTVGCKTSYRRPMHKLVMLLGEDDTISPRGEYIQAT